MPEFSRQDPRYEELYNQLYSRAVAMHENNKRRIRIGRAILILLPVILCTIRWLTDSDKVVFLIIYILCMFVLCAYLISVEYLDDSIQKTLTDVTNKEADFGGIFVGPDEIREMITEKVEERIEERQERREERIEERQERREERIEERQERREERQERRAELQEELQERREELREVRRAILERKHIVWQPGKPINQSDATTEQSAAEDQFSETKTAIEQSATLGSGVGSDEATVEKISDTAAISAGKETLAAVPGTTAENATDLSGRTISELESVLNTSEDTTDTDLPRHDPASDSAAMAASEASVNASAITAELAGRGKQGDPDKEAHS